MSFISFSELALGTPRPVFEFEDNSVSFNGLILNDGAQPTSPIVAASSRFLGPVFVRFENPVVSASFEAGFFDSIGSTRIEFRDASGALIRTENNSERGLVTFSLTHEPGISSISLIDESVDANGFGLDSLSFGPVAETLPAPTVVQGRSGDVVEFNFGLLDARDRPYSFTESLGPSDTVDTYAFTPGADGTLTVTTTLLSSGQRQTASFELTEGVLEQLTVLPVPLYDQDEAYQIEWLIEAADAEFDLEEALQLTGNEANFISLLITDVEISSRFLEVIANADGIDEIAAIFRGVARIAGPAGQLFDIAARLERIEVAGDDPNNSQSRQAYIELSDFAAGVSFTTLGTSGGAVAGGFFGGVGSGLGAILGGLGGNVIYTFGLSTSVRDRAGELFDAEFGPPPSESVSFGEISRASEAEPTSVFAFDEEFYLAEHPDAQTAVDRGEAPNGFAFFLSVGIARGDIPSSGSGPVPLTELAFDLDGFNPLLSRHDALFSRELGVMEGDQLSVPELLFHENLNDLRTDGTAVNLDDQLSALANRIARDWILNNETPASVAAFGADPAEWANTLSSGEGFRDAFAESLGTLSANITLLATFAGVGSPGEALDNLLASLSGSDALLGLPTNSIGIAEFGGVWVVLVDTSENQNDAVRELTPSIADIAARDDLGVLAAGATQARIEGGDGTDIILGGALDDTLEGGGGDDRIFGGGGGDLIRGGEGDDEISVGDIREPAPIGPSAIRLGDGDIQKRAGAGNDSFETARFIGAQFSFEFDENIENSTFVPHVTISAVGDGTVDFYRLDVTDGVDITLDIDFANGVGDGADFDSIVTLFNENFQTVARNDDSSTLDGAGGSLSGLDSFLTARDLSAGTYFISVEAFSVRNIDPGDTYLLHVSVDGDVPLAALLEVSETHNLRADGERGDDSLTGGEGEDTLNGGLDDDIIRGELGADRLSGDGGADDLRGGQDNDSLFGGAGSDTLDGGDGADALRGQTGSDRIKGGAGNDLLVGDIGQDTLLGGDDNDRLFGDQGRDFLNGGDGDDTLDGGVSDDRVFGGRGDDVGAGGSGDDILRGASGDDSLDGGEGEDFLSGESGRDELRGGAGDDTVSGGSDDDLLIGENDNDRLSGDAGDDDLRGGEGVDRLFGGTGADTLAGNDGADNLRGQEGSDSLKGGAGNDILFGGDGSDKIFGGGDRDRLIGEDGRDLLNGGDGADILNGGRSADTLTGGSGADRFEFAAGDGNDRLTDFSSDDTLVFLGQAAGDLTIRTSGADALILFTGGSVTLEGVDVATLDPDEFVFG